MTEGRSQVAALCLSAIFIVLIMSSAKFYNFFFYLYCYRITESHLPNIVHILIALINFLQFNRTQS